VILNSLTLRGWIPPPISFRRRSATTFVWCDGVPFFFTAVLSCGRARFPFAVLPLMRAFQAGLAWEWLSSAHRSVEDPPPSVVVFLQSYPATGHYGSLPISSFLTHRTASCRLFHYYFFGPPLAFRGIAFWVLLYLLISFLPS